MKTKNESKKYTVTRELKYRVSPTALRKIKKASEGYGMKRVLADAAGVRADYIPVILKTKLATSDMLDKLLAGVELIEKSKAA